MTTTAPGLQTVKPARTKARRAPLASASASVSVDKVVNEIVDVQNDVLGADDIGDDYVVNADDGDPTVYPDYEQMGRLPVESDIAEAFELVLRRYQASRGVTCYVGSDNFIYWVKGDNTACVSPDIYTLLGVTGKDRPDLFEGSKDEGCWKTWIHGIVPNFAMEVKAFRNPRKDELQSPDRHDALGTKELIVFDPFSSRRRKSRKRFVVYRRNELGKLVSVVATNDKRVYSAELDAFVVMDGDDHTNCMLRLGVGPNGETLLPFESELVDMEARRADEEARRADAEARARQEISRRADEEARRADAEARRADAEARRADEEARTRQEISRRADLEAQIRQEISRRADEATRRADELAAEVERLRAIVDKRPKRSAQNKENLKKK